MPLYTEPDEPEFTALEEKFRWFENVIAFEYGEREPEGDIPAALNWLLLLPEDLQLGIADVECSLAYRNDTSGYACTVWDASGEDDLPWAVFVADDFGARLLKEYSVLTEEAEQETLETTLRHAAADLPDRLLRGELDRTGLPVVVPVWLSAHTPEDAEAAEEEWLP
jgi:hypothetical protein